MNTKTGIESILGNFEKKHIDAIYNAAAQTIISHSEFRNKHFAYSLDNFKKKKLTEAGVELYPNGYLPHSHPFSKIVENYLLFDVLPGLVSKDLIMCSIKESKVEVFKKRKSESDISFINRLISSKDLSRYPDAVDEFFSGPREVSIFSNNFIRRLQGKTIFFHDEVHHWTKKNMFDFLKRTGVKRFLFTIVYPPEILKKFASSQNPKLYSFKVKKGKLFFFPDGVQSEAYEQQLNFSWLFSASHLESEGRRWTVTRHKSLYAHHLFEVSLGDFFTESTIFFNDFSSVDMSKLFLDRWKSYEVFPVSLQHLYKVYSYLLCLKKPDLESGLAKLRQIIGDDVEVKEFLFFEQFCKRIIERQTSWSLFGYSFFEKLTDMTLSRIPNDLARLFPSWKKKNTFEFLFSLGTLSIEIERGTVFEHVLQPWGFEVISTDENAYLDPMFFFSLNESFNEDRVDDGFLERVKLPFWNKRGYSVNGAVSKMNAYDHLSLKFSIDRAASNSKFGPNFPLMISYSAFTENELKTNYLFDGLGSDCMFNAIERFGSSYSLKIQKAAMETTVGEMINFSSKVNYKDFRGFLKRNLHILEFEIDDNFTLSGEDEPELHCLVNKGTGTPRSKHVTTPFCDAGPLVPDSSQELDGQVSPFWIDVGDSTSNQLIQHEVSSDIEAEVLADDDPSYDINYKEIFKPGECNQIHEGIINVPGDGNCFFHAFVETFECECDAYALRLNFSDWLMRSKKNGVRKMGQLMSANGTFMESETILLFCKWRDVTLVIHDKNVEGMGADRVWIVNEGHDEGHIVKTGEHFDALSSSRINTSLPENLGECITGFSNELSKFKIKSDDYRCFNWKGRKSAFLTFTDADYGHNGMVYPFNSWNGTMDEILRICNVGHSFNCALINFYEKNSKIGFHRDNEKVYKDDPILTVNLKGDGMFKIEKKGEVESFIMTPGSFFVMPSGFQRYARHSVSNVDERVSITFRLHHLKMNGSRIQMNDGEYKNMCLIKSISSGLGRTNSQILHALIKSDGPYWRNFLSESNGGTMDDCERASIALGIKIELFTDEKCFILGEGKKKISLKLVDSHFDVVIETPQMERTLVSGMRSKGNLDVVSGLPEYLSLGSSGFNEVPFVAESSYARKLVNSFLNMTTGICCGKYLDNGEKIFEHNINNQDDQHGTEVYALCGFAGSGKSRRLQNWLESRKKGNFCVVSPRNNLMMDWQFKLKLEPSDARKVTTYEKFLKMDKSKLDLIVLDEMTLFPNGYLDVILFELRVVNPGCKVLCIFDPLQSRYHSKSDEGILDFDHDVDRIIDGVELNYLYGSFRMTPFFDRIFDVPCLNSSDFNSERKIWVIDDVFSINDVCNARDEECQVLLVESDLEKKAFGSQIKTMTFGESQGLTFDHVCILLSESSANSNEYRWMVALTRARRRVSFVCTFLGGIEEFLLKKKGGLIDMVMSKEVIGKNTFVSMTKANLIFKEVKVGGADNVDREERLQGDPFLKPFIFLGQRVENTDSALFDEQPIEPRCQTHLYITEPNFGLCYNFDLIREKEQREYREDMMVTNQFCDSYEKTHPKGRRDTPGPLRFKAIYPKHSADDDMTFWMAVKKRLVFREEEENFQRLGRAHLIGGILYQNFKRKFGLSFNFDQSLLEECTNSFEKKKLEKSCGTIKSHSIRSDVDWPVNDVFLFMKSQLCTKFEKQFVDAKAGQTLACFQHLVLVKFAPWCRYLEQQIREQLPEEIYIHSNKNFDDLNAWTKKFFQHDICVESDYEAFDASQDEYILSFEMHLMKDANFPQEIIDAYVDLKCKLGCKLGHFAVMRFTGEFCTFLFNTLANMAFTLCRYNWRSGQPIAFAGDDMCALNNLSLCHDYDDLFESISLKAKVERTECPMFCGWRLTRYGIVKEPELVYNRFQVAIEEGKVLECLENYAIEVSYAYSLSERLYEVLKSERQIQYHQAVVRFIVTHIDKLKTKVKDLFIEQSSDEDI